MYVNLFVLCAIVGAVFAPFSHSAVEAAPVSVDFWASGPFFDRSQLGVPYNSLPGVSEINGISIRGFAAGPGTVGAPLSQSVWGIGVVGGIDESSVDSGETLLLDFFPNPVTNIEFDFSRVLLTGNVTPATDALTVRAISESSTVIAERTYSFQEIASLPRLDLPSVFDSQFTSRIGLIAGENAGFTLNTISFTPIPLPASGLIFLSGLGLLALSRCCSKP